MKKSAGLVRRVSSMFWSSQSATTGAECSRSLLIGGVFVICVGQTLLAWEASQLRLNVSYSDVFGAGILESIAGNDKYVGFLVRVDEDGQEELHRLLCPIEDLLARACLDRAEIKLGSGVSETERQGPLQLILPYLAQVGVATTNHVWLSNERCVGEDRVWASGAYDGQIALLTAKGLRLYQTQQRVGLTSKAPESPVPNQIAQLEQLAASEHPKERLQAAVAQYNQGNNVEAEALLTTIGDLDRVAAELSVDMTDQVPAHDPRWSRSKLPNQGTAQASLLIQKQLADKQAKHRLFVNFLKDRLGDEALDSLAQDGEKIELSARLRNAPGPMQSQLDQAIRVLVSQRKDVTLNMGLTHQDHYYQKISLSHQIVQVLAQLMDNTVVNSKDRVGKVSLEAIEIIQQMNGLACLICHACRDYRAQYKLTEGRRPWSTVLQEPLIELVKLNGANNIPSSVPSALDELLHITRFVLTDRLHHHRATTDEDILKEGSDFATVRAELINLFVEAEAFGEAGLLAEEFHDFGTLLRIYEHNRDETKLAQYLELGHFPDYVFSKYRGERLVKLAARHGGRLADLVQADPDHGWLLGVERKQLEQASKQLVERAKQTNENSLSKRTLLNMAKLTAIAGGLNELDNIKKNETLLNYQDRLPDKLLHVGDQTPALDGLDLIDALTSGNVVQVSYENGRDALDILQHIAQNERAQMKALIWSRLIESELASTIWKNALSNSHQPVEALRGTKFAQLLASAIEEELPLVDELQSELSDNAVFAFVVGAAVEARRGELCEMSA